jgi:hypothetical protein
MIDVSQKTKFYGHEQAVPPFKHLVVKGRIPVSIVLSGQKAKNDSLSFYFDKANYSSKGLYQTQGDTLLIDVENSSNLSFVALTCFKLPKIEAYNAAISLSGDTSMQMPDSISIVATSSRINIIDKLSFLKLNLLLNDCSRFDSNAKNIENLSISLNRSQCYFFNAVINQFKGTLTNYSHLNVVNAEKLEITADKSSKYYILPN